MTKRFLTICFIGFCVCSEARAQLAITEIQTGESKVNSLGSAPDWWELKNFGTKDIDLTGYGWNDGGQPTAASFYLNNNRAGFYHNSGLFHCPVAPLATAVPNPNIPNAYFSIEMNSKLISGNDTAIRASTIKQPSATVFFLENRLTGESMVDSMQATTDLGQPSRYANRFAARHGGTGNLAFVDGHAQGYKGSQVVQTTKSDPNEGKAILPQTQIVWTTDPNVSPN